MPALNTTFDESIARSYDDHLVPLIFEDYARELAGRAAVDRPERTGRSGSFGARRGGGRRVAGH